MKRVSKSVMSASQNTTRSPVDAARPRQSASPLPVPGASSPNGSAVETTLAPAAAAAAAVSSDERSSTTMISSTSGRSSTSGTADGGDDPSDRATLVLGGQADRDRGRALPRHQVVERELVVVERPPCREVHHASLSAGPAGRNRRGLVSSDGPRR